MVTTTSPQVVDLTHEQAWVLHDVLLDRIEAEYHDPAAVEPPTLEVYQAFEAIDSGRTQLSISNCHGLADELERAIMSGSLSPADIRTAEQLIDRLTELGL